MCTSDGKTSPRVYFYMGIEDKRELWGMVDTKNLKERPLFRQNIDTKLLRLSYQVT